MRHTSAKPKFTYKSFFGMEQFSHSSTINNGSQSMALGRPSKYKPEYCDMLIEHMKTGYSFESFAAIINVNQDTLHEWAKVHADFSEAKKLAFAHNLLWWEMQGMDGMLGQIKFFNSGTWIFNMKNRHKWQDKQEVEFSGNNVIKLAYDASKPIEKPQPQILEDLGNGKKTTN